MDEHIRGMTAFYVLRVRNHPNHGKTPRPAAESRKECFQVISPDDIIPWPTIKNAAGHFR